MPRSLPDEALEEVLCRLPPHEPADLVRAALVSRRWCRLFSDPGFRRRFREFHRRPPMLGMLCNDYMYDPDHPSFSARFVSRTAFCTRWKPFWDMSVLDVRHGRVLLHRHGVSLMVWDPIADPSADKMRKLPFPRKQKRAIFTAAVLCSAAGACDHLDCHQGPFLVVFMSSDEHGNAVLYTYSSESDAAAWSEPVWSQQKYSANDEFWMSNVLVGGSLYFKNGIGSTALKYDLDSRQVSLVLLPPLQQQVLLRESLLSTTDDDGLGLIYTDDSKLYMWSRKDTPEVDAKWESRVIELRTVFPDDVAVTRLIGVTGSGVGIIFMRTEREVYTIDLKTNEVKKVHSVSGAKLIPYMSFYTPGTTSFFFCSTLRMRGMFGTNNMTIGS
jgi:hypothetical protein